MNNTKFTLLRHGQPQLSDCLLGRTNAPLTALGWQQLRQSSIGLGFDRIISSPLERCSAFAQQLAHESAVPITICADWQEMDFGLWDGLPLKQLWAATDIDYPKFWQNPFLSQPPQGESSIQLMQRVVKQIQLLSRQYQGQHLLIVTHSGVIRIIMHWLLCHSNSIDKFSEAFLSSHSHSHQYCNAHLSNLMVSYAARLQINTFIDDDKVLWPQLTGLHNYHADTQPKEA
ncbi:MULTISPECIES: histidine phosphatase family protein [unclassified Shewanella]|uniref:histidine phosphatase family protein n=1 Tax=unclassified Shewanella TaxID=196818 RepID=UPI000C821640|nr:MULTISPECIES: histidine phosphatase family protein [unclassified Shewanella]MDO6620528.1 histidine phosphatase family protein [Shewanella sp. 6_MG-2023]PMG30929.1 hypothetical protein BCU94_10135 [Shewanella sp. 10N.286.52.C2]PMG51927.1 hypothetical protein BCU91_15860 [Shewanella sp. 10N.286.52.B9]